jgi:hypothetical protein
MPTRPLAEVQPGSYASASPGLRGSGPEEQALAADGPTDLLGRSR